MMRLIVRVFTTVSVVFCILISNQVTLAATANTAHYKLNNGLEVYLKADKRAPTTLVQLVYKAGSADETSGQTGVAHLLEHMLFRGTKKHPAGSYTQIVSSNGGQFNAWTSNDQTVYYAHIPKQAMPKILQLEADRMRNINFSNKNFNIEKNVVLEEWRMRIADRPRSQAQSDFNAAAYHANPYQHPVIGWHSDLTQLQPKYALDFYNKYYRPNNAVLIIIGDLKLASTKRLVKKYFSKLRSKKIPARIPNPQQITHGKHRITMHGNIHNPWLQLGFNAHNLLATAKSQQAYALLVLANALQADNSGLLPDKLIHKNNLASSVNVYYNPFTRYNSIFKITVSAMHGVKPKVIYKEILNTIRSLKHKNISNSELTKIKTITKADHVYLQDSTADQAAWIGMILGNNYPLNIADKFVDHINKVSAADVRRAADSLFKPDRETYAILLPLKHKPKGAK